MENITIKDVAKCAGVGVSTVSRVINNHPDVGEVVRTKVNEVIKQLNYMPNNSARNLKITETSNIGVLIKGIWNPFFLKMIQIIERKIEKTGYTMILQHVRSDQNELIKARELVKEKRLTGVIFLGGSFSHTVEQVQMLTTPFVFVTTTLQDCPAHLFSSVFVDDTKESYQATQYLLSLGHKQIVLLTADYENHSVAELRFAGFTQALATQRNTSAIHIQADEYSMQAAYAAIKKLLQQPPEFTAVYAVSDLLAIGACKALLDHGLDIPTDISVMGFDGQEFAKYFHPSITTIAQPVDQIAQKAVTQLFCLIHGGEHRQTVLEGVLLQGGSCDVARPVMQFV